MASDAGNWLDIGDGVMVNLDNVDAINIGEYRVNSELEKFIVFFKSVGSGSGVDKIYLGKINISDLNEDEQKSLWNELRQELGAKSIGTKPAHSWVKA